MEDSKLEVDPHQICEQKRTPRLSPFTLNDKRPLANRNTAQAIIFLIKISNRVFRKVVWG